MLISYKHKFIFIHVYKVAGSSIREALAPYGYEPHKLLLYRLLTKLGIEASLPYYKYKYFHEHSPAQTIREGLPGEVYEKFYKFAFVRNPWDWQVSLYHFMRQNLSHFQHDLIKQMNFDEYIEWRVSNNFKLQKEFITDDNGQIIVDFVGKYENLSEDFQHICRILKIDVFLPHINKSKHKDYRSYYNPRTRQMIEEHFQEDIELFGYTFDGFIAQTPNSR